MKTNIDFKGMIKELQRASDDINDLLAAKCSIIDSVMRFKQSVRFKMRLGFE